MKNTKTKQDIVLCFVVFMENVIIPAKIKFKIMTLQEVRIGNYYCNWVGQTCLMTKERFIHFASADIYRIYTIHVSGEWISNFGLFNDYRFSDVGVDIKDQSKIHFFGSDLILPMPKYVHKLQNLVFELTGKELISKNAKDND